MHTWRLEQLATSRQSLQVHQKSENADSQSASIKNQIGFDIAFIQDKTLVKLIIGQDDREFGGSQEGIGQVFCAGIKLMVSQCGGGITHFVHQLDITTSFEDFVIGASLGKIPGIKHQDIDIFLPHIFHKAHSTQSASQIVGIRFHLAMHIIRMQNDQRIVEGRSFRFLAVMTG